MGGKFTTLAGAEVAQAPANANLSRSLLYTLAIPVTHTGLRGSYAPGDTMKFTVGFNNGWDVLRESAATNCVGTNCADGKTIELGASLNPSKMFGLTASYYMGEEAGVTAVGDRTLLDVVATLNATDALTFVLNYDMGDQDNGTATGGTAEWDGWAAYANYAFTDKLRGSLRIESFDDKDGFRTGTVQELESMTLTVGYAPAKNVELRAEYRQDESDVNAFTEDGNPEDSQTFFGLEAIYKF
jgi:predicted porin